MTIFKILTGYFLSLFLIIALISSWAKNQSFEGPVKAQTIEKNLLINQILK